MGYDKLLDSGSSQYGFYQSPLDHSLFLYTKGNVFLALLVYVDDLVLTSNNTNNCKEFKEYLQRRFTLKDLGPLEYFPRIEVARSLKGLFLCQRKYTLDLSLIHI